MGRSYVLGEEEPWTSSWSSLATPNWSVSVTVALQRLRRRLDTRDNAGLSPAGSNHDAASATGPRARGNRSSAEQRAGPDALMSPRRVPAADAKGSKVADAPVAA